MIRRNATYKEKGLIAPLYKAIFSLHLQYTTCTVYMHIEAVSQEGHRKCLKKYKKEQLNSFQDVAILPINVV